jgi:uncharacterized protein YcnI
MKKLLTVALAGALWIAGAATAMAHVTVNPREATKGGFAKFDVRVPTERDDTGTVKVDLLLPEDHPIASVSVQPVPGWTYAVTKRHLGTPLVDDDGNKTEDVVSQITWTADAGNSIKPGEFMEFPISMGPLPDNADRLTFKANQTYASGEVVRWIEVAQQGQPEPEHPAPTVTLKDASTSGAVAATAAPKAGTTGTGTSSSSGRSTLALVVAIVAAALAIAALTATRKSSAGAASAPR